MKTPNIIALLWVASILGGGVQGSSVGTVGANRVAPSNDPTVSKASTLHNGIVLSNGIALTNGASRALALTALASRPLGKKD